MLEWHLHLESLSAIYFGLTLLGYLVYKSPWTRYSRYFFDFNVALGLFAYFVSFVPDIFSDLAGQPYFLSIRLVTFTFHTIAFMANLMFLTWSRNLKFLHDAHGYICAAVALLVYSFHVSINQLIGSNAIWTELPSESFLILIYKNTILGLLLFEIYQHYKIELKTLKNSWKSMALVAIGVSLIVPIVYRIQNDGVELLKGSQRVFESGLRQAIRGSIEEEMIPLKLLLSIKKEQSKARDTDKALEAARSALLSSQVTYSIYNLSPTFKVNWHLRKVSDKDITENREGFITNLSKDRDLIERGEATLLGSNGEKTKDVEIVIPYISSGKLQSYLVAQVDFKKLIERATSNLLSEKLGFVLTLENGEELASRFRGESFTWMVRNSQFNLLNTNFYLVTFPKVSSAIEFLSVLPNAALILGMLAIIFLGQLIYLYKNLLVSFDQIEGLVRLRTLELEEEKKKAEVASESKSQFLANVSHEIRTPLNIILGVFDLFEETKLDKQQKHFLSMLKQSGSTLLRMVNDLLDLAKVEEGRITLDPSPFNLHALLQELNTLYRVKAAEKGLQLVSNESLVEGAWYFADSYRLRQILGNLLTNSIKFTDSGFVSLMVEPYDGGVRLRVSDSGIGIPKDKLESIFDRFTQIDASTTRQRSGAGLGLTIAKKLTEMMYGRIECTSEIGKGTTFTVDLPLKVAEPQIKIEKKEVLPQKSYAFTEKVKVLIVDDSYENRELLKMYLNKYPCVLDEAENGEVALQKFKSQDYDIILMDMQMPIMDGYTATRLIREEEETQGLERTRVIALTAHAMKEDNEKCRAAGCDDYVSKPVSRQVLVEVMGLNQIASQITQ